MLDTRRRLFRRRASWLRENVHLAVTAVGLLASLYLWVAISNAQRPPTIEVASAEVSPSAATEELLVDEAAPPAPAGDASAETPPAAAEALPITAASLTIAAPLAQSPSASEIPLLPQRAHALPPTDSAPAAAPSPAPAKPAKLQQQRRAAPAARAPRSRASWATARQQARRQGPAVMASATRDRPSAKQAPQSYRDPFSCAVRKKPPCF